MIFDVFCTYILGTTSPVFAPTPGPPGQGPQRLAGMKSTSGPFEDSTSEAERAARERIEGRKEGRTTPFVGGARTPAPFKFPAPPKITRRSSKQNVPARPGTSQTFENPLMSFDESDVPPPMHRPTSAESNFSTSSRDVKYSPFVSATYDDSKVDTGETNPFHPQTEEELLAKADRPPTKASHHQGSIRRGPSMDHDRTQRPVNQALMSVDEDKDTRHNVKIDSRSGFAYIADAWDDNTFGMFDNVKRPSMAPKVKYIGKNQNCKLVGHTSESGLGLDCNEPDPDYDEPGLDYHEPDLDYNEPDLDYDEPDPDYGDLSMDYQGPDPDYDSDDSIPIIIHF